MNTYKGKDMDDFINDIGADETPKRDSNYNEDKKYSYNKTNYNKKFKKKDYSYIKGENKVNLWDRDTVTPEEIEIKDVKDGKRYVTISLPNKTFTLDEDAMAKFKKILYLLKKREYKVRLICNNARAIFKEVEDILGKENIYIITPWKTFCKEESGEHNLYLPSDKNINAAANYFKGFHKLPAAIQYILASVVTTMFGWYNNEPSTMFLTCDPFYDGKIIDFDKSRDTSSYYLLSRSLDIDIYNIADTKAYKDVVFLLTPTEN